MDTEDNVNDRPMSMYGPNDPPEYGESYSVTELIEGILDEDDNTDPKTIGKIMGLVDGISTRVVAELNGETYIIDEVCLHEDTNGWPVVILKLKEG